MSPGHLSPCVTCSVQVCDDRLRHALAARTPGEAHHQHQCNGVHGGRAAAVRQLQPKMCTSTMTRRRWMLNVYGASIVCHIFIPVLQTFQYLHLIWERFWHNTGVIAEFITVDQVQDSCLQLFFVRLSSVYMVRAEVLSAASRVLCLCCLVYSQYLRSFDSNTL